jgi:hypothetical protein
MTGNVPVSSLAMTQVTTIPIINIRLPLDIQDGIGQDTTGSVDLQTQLNSPDWYVENKMIVPKTKSVIFSRDIAVFYVNRRYNQINFARLVSPYALQTLPTASTGFERVNNTLINLKTIKIGSTEFDVASIVCVEAVDLNDKNNFRSTNEFTNTKIIIGNYAYIKCTGISNVDSWIVYNPRQATRTEVHETQIRRAAPVYKAPDAIEDGSRRGTIYIFERKQAVESNKVASSALPVSSNATPLAEVQVAQTPAPQPLIRAAAVAAADSTKQ